VGAGGVSDFGEAFGADSEHGMEYFAVLQFETIAGGAAISIAGVGGDARALRVSAADGIAAP